MNIAAPMSAAVERQLPGVVRDEEDPSSRHVLDAVHLAAEVLAV